MPKTSLELYNDPELQEVLDIVHELGGTSGANAEQQELFGLTGEERELISSDVKYNFNTLASLVRDGRIRMAVAVAKATGSRKTRFVTIAKSFQATHLSGRDESVEAAYNNIRLHIARESLTTMSVKTPEERREEWADVWSKYKDAEVECRFAADAVKKELTARANDINTLRKKEFGEWDAYFERAAQSLREEGIRYDALASYFDAIQAGGEKKKIVQEFKELWATKRQKALADIESKNGGLESLSVAPMAPSDIPSRGELVEETGITMNRTNDLFVQLPAYTVARAVRAGTEGWSQTEQSRQPSYKRQLTDVITPVSTPSRKRQRTSFGSQRHGKPKEGEPSPDDIPKDVGEGKEG